VFESRRDPNRKKNYLLEMFPYPSGPTAHGPVRKLFHRRPQWRASSACGDSTCCTPIGWDAFGLPA
jgi:leucyl-tRNA synthetase